MSSTTETTGTTTPRRNQRKTPLTPKKRDREDDESPPPLPTSYQPIRIGGGRIKKVKIPFDPSENNFPKRRLTVFADNKTETCWMNNKNPNKKSKKKSTESSAIAAENDFNKMCTICSKIDKRLGNLVSCKDCVATAHSSCIRKSDGQLFSGTGRNWICTNCETCVECYESALMQPLYKCISCNSCYHLECNDPNFIERSRASIQKTKFRCKNCIQFTESFLRKSKDELEKKNESKITSTTSVPTTTTSAGKKSTDIVSVKKNLFSSTYNEETSSSSSSTKRITEVGFAGFDDNELNQDKSLLLLSAIDDDGVTIKNDWKDADICDEKISKNIATNFNNTAAAAIENNKNDDVNDNVDIKIVKTESLQNDSSKSLVLSSTSASSLKYLNEPIPNVDTIVKWTKDDVYEYFLTYFPNEAIALKNKNIDGITLQLMKRDDVIIGLEINLGPALRMYHHLLRLQMQKNDISLGWM